MNRLSIVKRLESSAMSVFTTSQISALLGKGMESTRVLLSRLAKEGILVRVKRGHYCLPTTNVVCVASGLYSPSYVSLWAAFEYHGTTTQAPRVIDVINTDISVTRELSLEQGRYELRFIKTDKSFVLGMDKVYLDGKTAMMAKKEKAVVDGLRFNRYVPTGEVEEAIRDGINVKKAVEYAVVSDKQSVMKRLGYLLSQHGFECRPNDFNELSDTFVPLDPSLPPRGSYDTDWRVIDNRRRP